jgi:lysophospholipase L1-like esterase
VAALALGAVGACSSREPASGPSVTGGTSPTAASQAGSTTGATSTGSGASGGVGGVLNGAAGISSGGAAGERTGSAGGSASGGSSGAGGLGGGGGSGGGGSSAGTGGSSTGGSGGTGGASTGGSGGTGGYDPCPVNGDPCRVMPLGDSITDGVGSSHAAGYRLELFRLSLENQKQLTFVGSHESGPTSVNNVAFPRKQEGHSGWTIDDGGGRSGLYPKIQSFLAATPPHIITLMIGTNDIDLSLDVGNAPKRLGLLLDRIVQYAPDALIVLAQMVPTTDSTENQAVMAYNAAMPALVKARADAGQHVILVDMYGAFTQNPSFAAAYMNDKLHPKDAGYVVMANTWWAALAPLLKD